MSVRMVCTGQARHEHIRDMADFLAEAVEVASEPRNECSSMLLRKVYLEVRGSGSVGKHFRGP